MPSFSNQSAFPCAYSDTDSCGNVKPRFYQIGMSLREWYAGMAMQGMLASGRHLANDPYIAKEAFGVADEMLAYESEAIR